MAGIRLYHPTARSAVATFEHRKRPYPLPMICFTCKQAHAVKTYHVAVDHDGFAIVSPQVWSMMRRHNTAGFQMANEVASPPGRIVGFAPAHVDVIPLENNG